MWPWLPFHIVAMMCVVARLWAKIFLIRSFCGDDWITLGLFILYLVWFPLGHQSEHLPT